MKVPMRFDRDVVTDWAEASCILQHNGFLSRSEVERVLEDDEAYDVETITEDIWMEISRRHEISGTAHPVVTTTDGLGLSSTKTWKDAYVYSFQLLLACISYYDERELNLSVPRRNQAAKVFERLTTEAAGRYVGGKSLNIGSPRSGIPSAFDECIDYLCEQATERRGHVRRPSYRTNDARVDTVAWRPFGDERPSQVMIFLQCATGRHWRDKAVELSLDEWNDYVAWAAHPMRGFAFPFVCLDSSDWRRLSRRGGVLLDRLRISSLVTSLEAKLEEELASQCQSLSTLLLGMDTG